MATIGTLKYDLIANATKFIKGMTGATRATKAQTTATKSLTGQMGKLKGVIGGYLSYVGITRGIGVIQQSLGEVDELIKTARAIGLTTNELQGMRLAASELAGLTSGELDKSMEQFTRRLGEIANYGTGTTSRAFDLLGLSSSVASKKPGEALMDVARAWKNVTGETQKASVAYDLFGRSGVKMKNVMDGNVEELQKYMDITRQWLNLTPQMERYIEASNDALARQAQQWKSLTQILSIQTLPLLRSITEAIGDATSEMNNLDPNKASYFYRVMVGWGGIIDALRGKDARYEFSRRQREAMGAFKPTSGDGGGGVMGSRRPRRTSSLPEWPDRSNFKPVKVEITQVNELARALKYGSAEEYKEIVKVNTRLKNEEEIRHREQMEAARWGNRTLEEILDAIRQEERQLEGV